MWNDFWFFGEKLRMWQCPEDLLNVYKLAAPPAGYAWAQASDDAPYRLWKKASQS